MTDTQDDLVFVTIYKDTDIYVTRDGKFSAITPGKRKVRRTANTLYRIKGIIDYAISETVKKSKRKHANEHVVLFWRGKLRPATYLGAFARTVGDATPGHHFRLDYKGSPRRETWERVQVLRTNVPEVAVAKFQKLLDERDELNARLSKLQGELIADVSLGYFLPHNLTVELLDKAQQRAVRRLREAQQTKGTD